MIRALARRCRGFQTQAPLAVKPPDSRKQASLPNEHNSSGFRRVRARSGNEQDDHAKPLRFVSSIIIWCYLDIQSSHCSHMVIILCFCKKWDCDPVSVRKACEVDTREM